MRELEYKDGQYAQLCSLVDKKPKTIIRRFEKGSNRFYYWKNESGDTIIGSGITSLLKRVMPESPYLTEWKIDKGDWRKELNMAAGYGTILHVLYLDWTQNRFSVKTDYMSTLSKAEEYCEYNGLPVEMPGKDLLAYIKWVEDFKVKPVLMEAMLVSPIVHGNQYAMTIDLLAEMSVFDKVQVQDKNESGELVYFVKGEHKGEPKYHNEEVERRVITNVDFKSNVYGKDSKSFFDAHKYQLIAAKQSVKYNFDIDVEVLANFSPNNWENEPKYTFKQHNITEKDITIFDKYMEMASIQGLFEPHGSKLIINSFDNSYSYAWCSYRDLVSIENK